LEDKLKVCTAAVDAVSVIYGLVTICQILEQTGVVSAGDCCMTNLKKTDQQNS